MEVVIVKKMMTILVHLEASIDHKPHLLYFWQKMDDENILQHTCSIIPNHISAISEGVPSVSNIAVQNEVKKCLQCWQSVLPLLHVILVQTLSSLQTRFMYLSEQNKNAPNGPRKPVLQ
jgi:hypothetical protein